MSAIIDFEAYRRQAAVPTLVLVDLQEGSLVRAGSVAGAALGNCRAALRHARAMGFPVALVRWVGRTRFFASDARSGRWIEGFEPLGSDMIFERGRPSCYASHNFADVMTRGGGENIVLAGLAGEVSCLSTAVDGFHRGHKITFLSDASASHDIDEVGATDVHRVVSKVIGLYGELVRTTAWIAGTERRAWVMGSV